MVVALPSPGAVTDHAWGISLEEQPGVFVCRRCDCLLEQPTPGELRFSTDGRRWGSECPACEPRRRRPRPGARPANVIEPLSWSEVYRVLRRFARSPLGGGSHLDTLGQHGRASTFSATHGQTVAAKLERCPHVERALWLSEAIDWIKNELRPKAARGQEHLANLRLVRPEVRDVLFEFGVGLGGEVECTGGRTCSCVACELTRALGNVTALDDSPANEPYAWEMLELGCEFAACFVADPSFREWVVHRAT